MGAVYGWSCWQKPEDCYEIGVDKSVLHESKQSGYVRSVGTSGGQFGALMQKVAATNYRGKRVRFSAYIMCKRVDHSCGMFMEVFSSSQLLSIDNMTERSLTGDQRWSRHELVLDVPEEAYGINIGVRVVGQGQVWINGITFAEVGTDVAVTGEIAEPCYPREPQNLDFATY